MPPTEVPACPSRRTVARGLAWAAPAVASVAAAPLAAASPCRPVNAVWRWDAVSPGKAGTGGITYTLDPDGTGPLKPVSLTVAQTFGANMRGGSQHSNGMRGTDPGTRARVELTGCKCNINLQLSPFVLGLTGRPGLAIHQSPIDNSKRSATRSSLNSSTTTFTFSAPVSNLQFTITDIDSVQYDYIDQVAVTGASYTPVLGSKLSGKGTTTEPFRPTQPYANAPESTTSLEYMVRLTFPTVTSFAITYFHTEAYSPAQSWAVDADQSIFLSDFTFTYQSC